MTTEQMNVLQQKTRALKNDKLLDIIRKMKAKYPEQPTNEEHTEYVEELIKARLIIPVSFGETDKDDPNKMQVTFSHLTNNKGDKYFMLFTDMETLLKNAKDDEKLKVLGITYNDLVQMLSAPQCNMKGFVINPFTENIVCGPDQGKAINQYITHKKIQSGELTVINELTDIPDDVVKELERHFDSLGCVKKAYMMSMRKADKRYRLIIVDTDETVEDFPEFAKELAQTKLREMNDAEVPYLVMSYAEEAAKRATKEKVPIYVKV